MLLIKDTTFRPSSSQFSGIHYFGRYGYSYVLTIMLLFPRNAVSKTVRCIFVVFWFGGGGMGMTMSRRVTVTLQSTIFQVRNQGQKKVTSIPPLENDDDRGFILNQFYEIYCIFFTWPHSRKQVQILVQNSVAAPWESIQGNAFSAACAV